MYSGLRTLAKRSVRVAASPGLLARAMSTSAPDGHVAFVGLGNMGLPMAQNLLAAGEKVCAFDLAPEPVATAQAEGATTAANPGEATNGARCVITMLPGNDAVKAVYRQEGGIFDNAQEGALFIDCSTIDPNVSKEVASEAEDRGFRMIDAPVSGGVGGAAAGTLSFMCGSSDENLDLARPLLEIMGANIFHCGANGAGGAAKLCNNLLLGISMIGVCEAYALGEKLGLDANVLASVINTSTGRCWSSDTYNPFPGVLEGVPSSRDYEGGFGSALMLKDLGLALDAAKTSGQALPLGAQTHALYSILCSTGSAGKDFGAMMELLRK